ncbi:phage tail protein [Uliginosibacterium gangwonense]|uniref:phage tail protein n=1 Tax=Uliginosibacterium gangwonense TaxID=392736 RepID=UPI000366A3EC|nr:tail fiber protein [Uliginosibacterium gangwonense]
MDPIIGMIVLWPIAWVPDGWHLCDGTVLNVANYQALFSLIGAQYGGNGSSTFALPDLRNKFPLGSQTMTDIHRIGGNNTPVTLTSTGVLALASANIPAHTHSATFAGTGGGNTNISVDVAIPSVASTTATPAPVAVPGNTLNLSATAGPANKIYSAATTDSTLKPFAATGTINIPTPAGNVTVSPTGPTTVTPVNVAVQGSFQPALPPFMTMNFIIALEGIYPTRP